MIRQSMANNGRKMKHLMQNNWFIRTTATTKSSIKSLRMKFFTNFSFIYISFSVQKMKVVKILLSHFGHYLISTCWDIFLVLVRWVTYELQKWNCHSCCVRENYSNFVPGMTTYIWHKVKKRISLQVPTQPNGRKMAPSKFSQDMILPLEEIPHFDWMISTCNNSNNKFKCTPHKFFWML